ncbi:sensor histidine kinase [Peribacillus loiseleuriae]|uniref:sensor histidine kinase n=1 Tax=Peribacillus loiseleuriae TaxID=1679170 RepID=UPI00381D2694
MIGRKVISWIRKHFLYSFKSTINALFVPIIILFITLTGWISYLLAAAQIEENAYKNINDTVFQTKRYLEDNLTDVFEQLVALSNNPHIYELISTDPANITPKLYIELDKELQVIQSHYDTVIESLVVDMHGGEFFMYRSIYSKANSHFSYETYFDRFAGGKENFYWQNLHSDEIFNNKREVVSVFKLIGHANSKANGILIFNLRYDFFERVFNESLIGENGYLTLISPDGTLNSKTVSAEYRLDDATLSYMNKIENKKGQFSFVNENGNKMIVIYETLGVNKWKVAAVLPEAELLNKANYIKFVTIGVIIILILIAVCVANFLVMYITKPLTKLVKQMKNIDGNNLDLSYEIAAPKEFEILQSGFKDLMTRIHALLLQNKLDQEEKRQLEFAIMHAQINPHFLYNTLYSIKGLCDMGQTRDASTMISALSHFFRISISRGREIISIEEELEHIKNYLYIQEMRYGDEFTYEMDVDPRILPYNIIKLTLQPLIENAIYHGVKQRRGQGVITVKGYEHDQHIIFAIKDNGIGISEARLKEIKKEIGEHLSEEKGTVGIGLKSVDGRIKIHFGTEYGLMIDSEEGRGTTITVLLPKIKGEAGSYAKSNNR